jgi:hypothetical protein
MVYRRGFQPFAHVASAKALKVDAPDAPLVCLSYFGAVGNPAHVRFLILVEPPDDLTLPHVGSSSATPRPPETNLAVEVVAGHSARGI